ncbi:MAG: histidine kinase dimerization/phospho-acceptor domain-containing protein, partial [Thermoanaerobaculia bacterium]
MRSRLSDDLSVLESAEAERERLIAELESKNTELEQFSFTASHDLKSPLITIQGFLGLLEKDIASGDRQRAESDLARISSAAEKMSQLVGDLLELPRIGRARGCLRSVLQTGSAGHRHRNRSRSRAAHHRG